MRNLKKWIFGLWAAVMLAACGGGGGDFSPKYCCAPPPACPTGIIVQAGDRQNLISWNAATNAVSYTIYYGTLAGVTPANGTAIKNISSTSYMHTGLTNGTVYYYAVSASNGNGESALSMEASGKPQGGSLLSAPAAPANVAVVVDNGQNFISWDSSGASSYNLYWSTAAGVTVKTAGTKIANVTSPYSHTGLTNGTAYHYIVTAVNAVGESAASLEAVGTPLAAASSGAIDVAYGVSGLAKIGDGTNSYTFSEIKIQSDGKIIGAGDVLASSGASSGLSARINVDGSVDSTLLKLTGPSVYGSLGSLYQQTDGKLLTCGWYYNGVQTWGLYIDRFNTTDGSADTTFGTSGQVKDTTAYLNAACTLQPDGKIVTVASKANGSFYLSRYNSAGQLDGMFGQNGTVTSSLFTLDILPRFNIYQNNSGRLLVVGTGNKDIAAVEYNSDGTLNASFGMGGYMLVNVSNSSSDFGNAGIFEADGKIFIAGSSNSTGVLVRLSADGSRDTSFGISGILTLSQFKSVSAFALAPSGKIIIAGRDGSNAWTVARLATSGVFDSTFGTGGVTTIPGTYGSPSSVIINGQYIYVGGYSGIYAVVARLK